MGELPEHLEGKTFKDNPQNINRTGANKGSSWSKTIIKKYFDQEIKGKGLDDEEVKIPAGELAIISCLKKALNGDTKALKELLDRLEGTSTQTINQKVENTGGVTLPPNLSFDQLKELANESDKTSSEDKT